MHAYSLKRNSLALLLSLLGTTPLTAFATPPSDSPYAVDPQSAYVQDATSDGIANLNMVLCIMDAMRPADMVNKGAYIALVDKNKCDSKSQANASNSTSGASGATAAPDYMNAVVDVTRASDTDPMLAKIWMSMSEEGHSMNIYVHLTATQSPTDAPPYGQFRLDYIGKDTGNSTQFNGFIDANGADVSYLETGGNSSNTALAMTASSTTAASGVMQTQDNSGPVTFRFAYDASDFLRSDGTQDVCFDRSRANAQKSVWRYGVYNAETGARVDQDHPGFPITVSSGGNTSYGFASYWGINAQGLDLSSLPDGEVVGTVVTDQRPNHTTDTYSLFKASGKLTKWTQSQQTLAAMDGVPFFFNGDLTGQTDQVSVAGFNNWQMQWNDASHTFTVTGAQSCGNNGCVLTTLGTVATVTGTAFDHAPISGWSNSFGGNINIPPTGAAHAGTDNVFYYTQSDVVPGDSTAPTALYCLSQCPTAAAATVAASPPCGTLDTANCSPYGNNTAFQWNSASSATDTVSYSFGSDGLMDGGTVIHFADALFMGSPQFQNGLMTGRLFDSAQALSNTNCPPGAPGGMVCEPSNPSVYYTWQTGPNPWNQTTWLKAADNSIVQFDSPENIPYTVPNDTAYGTWANKNILLQFNGFGNLNGIPGYCVDPTDNSTVDCGSPNSRYVSMFSLPDGATMTLPVAGTAGTPLIVKALNQELRLSKVACNSTNLTVTGNNLQPPSGGTHDPSDASDVDYIGDKPVVTDAPKVIHGVVQ